MRLYSQANCIQYHCNCRNITQVVCKTLRDLTIKGGISILTYVAALDQCLIDVMLSDVLQDVEETGRQRQAVP